jgi:hypothetical protein
MNNIVKWVLIFSCFGALYGGLEYNFEFFSSMFLSDPTGLCNVIGLFALYVYFESFLTIYYNDRFYRITIAQNILFSLGLLGTFIGIYYSLDQMPEILNAESIEKSFPNVLSFFRTALSTTITAMLCNLPLVFIAYFIKGAKSE